MHRLFWLVVLGGCRDEFQGDQGELLAAYSVCDPDETPNCNDDPGMPCLEVFDGHMCLPLCEYGWDCPEWKAEGAFGTGVCNPYDELKSACMIDCSDGAPCPSDLSCAYDLVCAPAP